MYKTYNNPLILCCMLMYVYAVPVSKQVCFHYCLHHVKILYWHDEEKMYSDYKR